MESFCIFLSVSHLSICHLSRRRLDGEITGRKWRTSRCLQVTQEKGEEQRVRNLLLPKETKGKDIYFVKAEA